MAIAAMYGVAQVGRRDPDARGPSASTAPIGELPAVSLPVIAAGLGGLFGLDSSVPDPVDGASGGGGGRGGARKRVAGPAASGAGRPAAGKDAEDADDADLDPRQARR